MALSEDDAARLEAARQTARARVQQFVKSVPQAVIAEDLCLDEEFARSNASPQGKLEKIYRMIHAFSEIARPYTACKSGCAGCCHMNVAVTPMEAQRLAVHSGRDAAVLSQPIKHAPAEFLGVPCPFLVDAKCSVYEVRPLACRSHMSFDVDGFWCQPQRSADAVLPQLRLPGISRAYASIAMASGISSFSDIRDYFG